ncbi:hypothetical protein ACLB1E_03510 [Escherichia coli]
MGEAALSKLDESGIVYIGAEVTGGNIWLVTPKGETQLTQKKNCCVRSSVRKRLTLKTLSTTRTKRCIRYGYRHSGLYSR